MSGAVMEARQILQAGIYQIVLELLNLLIPYMALCPKDEASFEETCRRTLAIADTFHLQTLHPGILLNVYLSTAQEYLKRQNKEKALDLLELYAKLAVSDIYPLRLKGDSYFTLLDSWLEEHLPLGCSLPREESMVRKSMIEALTKSPVFAELFEEKRFVEIVRILKDHRRNNL